MHASATAEIDNRAGASWMTSAGPAERLQLLAALLSRFNHDIRTPLNTITGWAHLLQKGSVESARIGHVADVIARNGRDQTLMLDAFIEDARIIQGRLPLEAATVSVDDLIAREITQTSGAENLRSSLQVRIEAGGTMIDGDSRLLQRLIHRLAVVIARRTDDGATINLSVSRDDRWICMSLTAPTGDADWSESDLLELRISTLMAAVFRGKLELLAGPGTAALRLLLPEAVRPK